MTSTTPKAPAKPSFERVLRARARRAERFESLGMPGRKHEEWRFVKLNGLTAVSDYVTEVELDEAARAEISAMLKARAVEEARGRLVVCVNGVFEESLSDLSELESASVRALSHDDEALLSEGGVGELSALIQQGQDYFTALSDESYEQALIVEVKKEQSAGCVHLICVQHGERGQSALSLPRVRVEVGRGAKLSLIEEHVSTSSVAGSATFTLSVVEAELKRDARLEHVKVQEVDRAHHHIARLATRLDEGAHYASVTFHFGALLSRQDAHAEIDGGNTLCELHGLTLIDEAQVSDTHSVMNHVHPHAKSDQVHKCVVGGRAHAIFNGKIFVRQGAQQIDAFQLNRNLLLSDRARVDTKPQLEILADDVKCSHGATIGQLDAEQLFYLQTRGVDAEAARGVLTYAFAAELLDRVPFESLKRRLGAAILERTQQQR